MIGITIFLRRALRPAEARPSAGSEGGTKAESQRPGFAFFYGRPGPDQKHYILICRSAGKRETMKNGITTEHSIPGRIRFKIPAIRNKPEKAQAYQNAASQIPGVLWAGGNPKSGSLVVRYDSGTLDGPTLRASLNGGPQPPGRRPGDLDASPATKKNRTNGDSRPSGLVRFAGLTALTAGVFFREAVLKTPVSQALFSPLGVMVALASLPLVRSGLRNLSRGSVTLESFLGGGVLRRRGRGRSEGGS